MKKIHFLVIVFLGFFANAQVISFTDINFKNRLLSSNTSINGVARNLSGDYFAIDSNGDNEIDIDEALEVSYLNVSGGISNLDGLENFINIIEFKCNGNNLVDLNLTFLVNLTVLECMNCNLSNLNLNGLNIISLAYNDNNLSSFNLNNFVNLRNIYCANNGISSLNITNLTQLQVLYCPDNQIENIDLTNAIILQHINCTGSLIEYIDLTHSKFLNGFNLSNNNLLKTVLLKNGRNYNNSGVNSFNLTNCSNLEFLCVDSINQNIFQNHINNYGYTNCNINSYCSFTPGGEYFTILGNQIFDINNNGCENNDNTIPNFKYNITNGIISGTIISSSTGNYSIPVQAGTHTITPIIENPNYFNISPSSFNVSFPTDVSPFTQNFCITPNGIHNDLEIIVLPISPARPGFDASYKITYKNNGNLPQSGVVSLTFNDLKTDFISSFPLLSSQIDNLLTWDYANLLPFETREIDFILNINSPMETPAVNVGDQISFTATIDPTDGDEYLNDNTSRFKQTIVGSIDPNDKTCIEGNVVGSEMIGEYVHYIIRFENTGTFAAENIVVSDEIDTAKFDVSSLVPTNSNYPFVTRINNNKVEFIFEGINLPFDNATNDGYVAFKIKTLPSLVVGNTFSNKANIYFDYNFPIETNTASTSIQVLGNIDFEFSDLITLFPNPVKNVLNFNSKLDIKISSINIYNALGQLVEVATNPIESIDVSNLKTGNYFIKVITNKGTSNSKFIKE